LKVLVKLVGGKVGKGEKDFSFTFHWPPRKEPSPSPSIGHQAKNLFLHLPLATKQPSLSPSFPFSLKGGLRSLEPYSSLDIIFNSIGRILVSASFLKKRKMISFSSGGKEGK
jgi:hypothetical protein